jgi:HNH endonuclease
MAKFRGAILECKTCGKTFKVPPVRSKTAKYCSPGCAGKGRGPERELPKVAIVCAACGKTFFEHGSHASRRVYCSNGCRNSDATYKQTISERTSRENNAAWKGGTTTHRDGYIYELCPEHPFARCRYVFQHRLIVERYLRENLPKSNCLVKFGNQLYLDQSLAVHHVNGDKTDNRIENLQVMTSSEHQKIHNALRRQSQKEKEK